MNDSGPKRILIFSTDDFLYPAGGAEVAFGEIAKRLPHIQFALICARLRNSATNFDQVGNVAIHRIGVGHPKIDAILLALFGARKARALHKEKQFDLAWVVMASYGGFAALSFHKKTGVPYLLTLQEGDPFEYIEGKVRFVKGRFLDIFRSASGLQAISNYLFAWGKKNGFAGPCAKVVPNGVDIERFAKPLYDDERQKIRASFGFAENAKIVITSSRLEVKNGVGDIIDALPMLPENVCLVICGGGSLEMELKKKAETHGLLPRVRFMGYLPQERLPALLHSADVFIRPALSEGLGNVFLEAMAAGIPVIGTPVGGIPDFLADGITGFFCEPKNPESVALAIGKTLDLPAEKKKEIVDRARAMVGEKYEWNRISKEMESMFECAYAAGKAEKKPEKPS